MGDMKGMEDWLSDYGVLKYGLNGEYRELKEGDRNKEQFMGGEVGRGRG